MGIMVIQIFKDRIKLNLVILLQYNLNLVFFELI